MGYGNPNGCCCGVCAQSLFSDGGDVTLDKWTFTGDEDNFSIAASPTRLELNDGTGSTPAASGRKTITSQMRGGSQNFSIQTRVYSVFNGVGFDSEQTGLFIADAFALWVDWNDNTLRYAATDAVGTINTGANTLIHTYGAMPFGQSFQAKLYRNANDLWNVEIWSTADDGSGGNATAILYDQTFSGLAITGEFEFGVTATTGGGGWRNLITACAASSCLGCADGDPLEWTKTHAAIPELIGDSADMVYLGRCISVMSPAPTLDPAIDEVQIGILLSLPHIRPLVNQAIQFILIVRMQGEDNIYLTAEVLYLMDNGIDSQELIVAMWSIPRDQWCCYGANELTLVSFSDPTFGGFGHDLNTGSPAATRTAWLQNIATWPATITVEAVGPDPATPCTVDCLWTAELVGDVLTWSQDDTVCPAGLTCAEPGFSPAYEGQQAYTVCE